MVGQASFLVVVFQIVIFIILNPLNVIRADNNDEITGPCLMGESVVLANTIKNDSGYITDNGLFFPLNSVRNEDGVLKGCICEVKPCLAICPPENTKINADDGNTTANHNVSLDYNTINYSGIPKVYTRNLTIDETLSPHERFHFFLREPCKVWYLLYPETYPDDEFYLLGNGTLLLSLDPSSAGPLFRNADEYCLQKENDSNYVPRLCSPIQDQAESEYFVKAKYVAGLVGVPFLIVTVIVYSILPELRNIHGTTLRCYLCCLIVTYIAFALDRMPEADFDAGTYCLILGFTVYCSFLASFFWLNVMCIDMWLRFGGCGGTSNFSSPQNDRKRFISYSMYAWGSTFVMTAICIGMEFSPLIPESIIRPGFRLRACWFESKSAEAAYFYGPVSILIASNVCLFILTTIKLFKLRTEMQNRVASRRNEGENADRYNEETYWFGMHLKLFIVMGISWSTEIISWLWEGPKHLWLVTDMVNSLQGILIFVIFICKRSIWRLLKKRFSKQNSRDSNSHNHNATYLSLNTLAPVSPVDDVTN